MVFRWRGLTQELRLEWSQMSPDWGGVEGMEAYEHVVGRAGSPGQTEQSQGRVLPHPPNRKPDSCFSTFVSKSTPRLKQTFIPLER